MATMAQFVLMRLFGAWLVLFLSCSYSLAQNDLSASRPDGAADNAGTLVSSPYDNERLSDWLVRHHLHLQIEPVGLIWQVPAERSAQSALQQNLVSEIARSGALAAESKKQWLDLVQALPVTGRVPLPATDARWLQAKPSYDPVLARDHVLQAPGRAKTVAVLSHDASLCQVPHAPGAQARDYLRACAVRDLGNIDLAWVIQPDGYVQKVPINFWNAQDQGELAPGALIWAPTHSEQTLGKLPELLPAFLATQAYKTVLNAGKIHRAAAVSEMTDRMGRPARSLPLTSNDWGIVGLLQTPTARMADAGEMRFHFSRVLPYERFNVFAQPFDWLEAGFRYTNVTNRLYGPAELSGAQAYKDKSIDFKVKLVEERRWVPQVAMGMIDFGGTGLFASEYVVANKRLGNWDASLGMAWGYLGSSGNVANPLSRISPAFDTRSANVSMGGTPAIKSFFRGATGLFGGLQYHAPWSNWVLKAEYDGNDYRSEPQSNNRKQIWPLNLGVVYRANPWIDLSFGIERGNTAMFGLTLHASAASLGNAKVSDPPTPRVSVVRPQREPDWTGTAADIAAVSRWGVIGLRRFGSTLRLEVEGASGAHWNERIDRIVSVLHRDAPASIDSFELIMTERGVVLSERLIDRQAWVKQSLELLPPSAKVQSVLPVEPRDALNKDYELVWRQNPSRFGYALIPSWQQNIGGPDGFLLFRAGLSVPMQLKLSESVRLSASVNLNLVDNFGKFKYTAPSNVPRVRTYLREYMTDSRVNLTNLQVSHFGQLASNHYYGLYGGYLEGMFGGVGAEWLYRPWHSPLAFGLDINRVQQRSFDQSLSFGKAGAQTGYKVTTGHATAYWDTGWNDTHVRVSVGQYLAGDVGATVDVSKTFKNGVSMGVWATKTNVSAAQFGEGSFDKGLYLRIPFDVMATMRTGGVSSIVYNPLTRDGGARLNRDFTLYGETTARSLRETGFSPALTQPAFRMPR